MAVLLRTLSQALLTAQSDPAFTGEDLAPSTVYRRRCRKSLKEAIKITRGLADSDFPFIDVAMAVGFSFAVDACCARVADGVRLFLGSTGVLVPDPDAHGGIGS